MCGKLPAVLLRGSVDKGQVVIIGLHGPYRVPLRSEGLSGISTYACIDKHRQGIVVKDARPHIVVVMAFLIVSAFRCEEEAVAFAFGVACHADLGVFKPISAGKRFALRMADDVFVHKKLVQCRSEISVYPVLETLVLLCHE